MHLFTKMAGALTLSTAFGVTAQCVPPKPSIGTTEATFTSLSDSLTITCNGIKVWTTAEGASLLKGAITYENQENWQDEDRMTETISAKNNCDISSGNRNLLIRCDSLSPKDKGTFSMEAKSPIVLTGPGMAFLSAENDRPQNIDTNKNNCRFIPILPRMRP